MPFSFTDFGIVVVVLLVQVLLLVGLSSCSPWPFCIVVFFSLLPPLSVSLSTSSSLSSTPSSQSSSSSIKSAQPGMLTLCSVGCSNGCCCDDDESGCGGDDDDGFENVSDDNDVLSSSKITEWWFAG